MRVAKKQSLPLQLHWRRQPASLRPARPFAGPATPVSSAGRSRLRLCNAMLYSMRAINYGVIVTLTATVLAGCNGLGAGQGTSPGSTPNIAQQSSYRIVGDVGTPFRALISDSRSSWEVFGTIPTSIVIVNDSPPDRILVTKTTNNAQ